MINKDLILSMRHSPIQNYGVPGLTSWLIGDKGEQGCVRLFECTRTHYEPFAPHTHRYDLQSFVLEGNVENIIWTPVLGEKEPEKVFDQFQFTSQKFIDIGEYEIERISNGFWKSNRITYGRGAQYFMDSSVMHSIYFKKGALVLIIQGPTKSDSSFILEPFVDGEVIPSLEVKPWMFKRVA